MSILIVCGGSLIIVGIVLGLAIGSLLQNKYVRAAVALVVIIYGGWFVASNYDGFVAAWEKINRLAPLLGGVW